MARKLDSRDNQEPSVSDSGKSPPTEQRRTVLDRRTYLKLGTAAMSALTAVAVGGALTKNVSRHGIDFTRSRDAVDDLGMDPTGEEPIDRALDKTVDGDLIRFPDGTYRFDGESGFSLQNETRGFEGIGKNAAFRSSTEGMDYSLDAREMDGIYISDLNFDQSQSSNCISVRLTGDRVVCSGIELIGSSEGFSRGGPLLSHATESADERSLFNDVVATARCENQPPLGRPGIFLEQSHEGTLTVRNCDLRQFPNAAVHSTRHSGNLRVVNSYFENNASAIRFSNPGSKVKRSEIVVNERPRSVPHNAGYTPYRLHGIAVGVGGTNNVSNGALTVVNSTIRIAQMTGDWPAVVAPSSGAPLELRDCTILFDNDGQSVISVQSPGRQTIRPTRPLCLRNSVVQGSGSVNSVVVATNADSSTVADSSLQLAGGDGITIHESEDWTIERTNICVPGRAGVVRESSVNALEINPSQSVGPENTLDNEYPHQLVVGGNGTATAHTLAAETLSPEISELPDTEQGCATEAGTSKRYRFGGALEELSLDGTGSFSFSSLHS